MLIMVITRQPQLNPNFFGSFYPLTSASVVQMTWRFQQSQCFINYARYWKFMSMARFLYLRHFSKKIVFLKLPFYFEGTETAIFKGKRLIWLVPVWRLIIFGLLDYPDISQLCWRYPSIHILLEYHPTATILHRTFSKPIYKIK